LCRAEAAPLGESSGAVLLEVGSAGETAFLVEMVRDGGAELHRKTDDEIRELIRAHGEFDLFASKVIQEACERERDARCMRA
jgi:hypothetical protein